MSRAFIRDEDAEAAGALPDRPISPHPNFVTAAGERQIDQRLLELQSALAAARAEGPAAIAALERELRYWRARRASARVIAPAAQPRVVRFGVGVSLRFDDGSERGFQVVGEDEADPARGLVSWTSPVGGILIGRTVGDTVTIFGRKAVLLALYA
ncbi:MAG TPA: GreA/GreB family elongation factor [Steroidobacteraceae bacterium]